MPSHFNQPEGIALARHPIPHILKQYGTLNTTQTSSPSTSAKPLVIDLASATYINAFHLAGLVDDNGGDYEKYRKSSEELKTLPSKLRKFYEKQNEVLDYFKEIDNVLDEGIKRTKAQQSPEINFNELEEGNNLINNERQGLLKGNAFCGGANEISSKMEKEEEEGKSVRFAINVNFLINFILLAGKIVVALLSNSISLIASLVDSAMDFLSTAIIWWTNRKIETKSWQSEWQYPTGKRRMEPMGVVIFSVFMISSFVQVLVESIERLFSASETALSIPFTSFIVMVITILVKGIVWLWCRRKKNTSVKALAQDAENDCVLNIFSLLFPYLGQLFNLPWLDAVGGLVLSIYIITEWSATLFDNVQNLTGRRADPIQHQRVAYLVTRFSPLIRALQHCHVYQAGDDLIVETDVILSPDTPLPTAHDLGESVQYALESLDGVARAYCHVDFSSNPMSGHFQR
ncbi:hypothetical protein CROQUDRAFT_655472 [Cronartium quercuum f. sp. fusiforme G11]|uniref:Cation efflux protein transmembrane domain-containing protein n=1 Tax=Cronartium quercuum f. sp. fusiforme G11 TaxID=708437 RepID=A0A9P6NQU6_9BASI|nr:hypothetical protein CROQUDRAFT_655472 [Cronartium quercuum f. sp. fusiforme G11]